MKQIFIFLVVVAALAVGAFAGFHYASHRYAGAVTATIASYEFQRAADTFTTLHDLRAGDTNAVFDSLESQLDVSTPTPSDGVGVLTLRWSPYEGK